MERPATDTATDAAADTAADTARIGTDEWLLDADDPTLTAERLARIADATLADRLAWNTFRTLALWNTEAWVPSLLETAIGEENAVGTLEWAEGTVIPWGAGPPGGQMCQVAVEGPAAYVVFACTVAPDPPEEELRAAAVAALDGSLHPERQAGLVVVGPPGSEHIASRIGAATDVELHQDTRIADLLAGASGWVAWTELGRLALDLAEEGDRQPVESVRRLVAQLQSWFPNAEM